MIKIYNLLIINSLVHLFQDVIYVKTSEMTSGNTLIESTLQSPSVTVTSSVNTCRDNLYGH